MSKYKKIIFIFVLVAVLIPIIIFFLSSFINGLKKPLNKKGLPAPTSTQIKKEEVASVVSIFPSEDINKTYLPIQQVIITFSKPLLPIDVNVSSDPYVAIDVKKDTNDPYKLIISPRLDWETGITTIKIKDSNTWGKRFLKEDFEYRINTDFPKNDPNPVP